MIPSLNALKTALKFLLLNRVDIHAAISALEILEPDSSKILEMKNIEHDLYQVCEMINDKIELRS